MIHVIVLAGAVTAVHNFGPQQLQVPVDRYVVGPVLRTSEALQRQIQQTFATVGGRLGSSGPRAQ